MRKLLFLITILQAATIAAHAQDTFLDKGVIEFEREIFVLNKAKEDAKGSTNNGYINYLKQSSNTVNKTHFTLSFNDTKTLYKFIEENTGNNYFSFSSFNDNTVFKDFNTGSMVSRKSFYQETYLIQDSIKQLKWKITDEIRTIAGFECKKATAIIMDSVFVVAFYTDQIPVSSGPESFSGLPGMIMGLAIPRLHTTWYATKVQLQAPKETELIAPAKGKKISSKDFDLRIKKMSGSMLWQSGI